MKYSFEFALIILASFFLSACRQKAVEIPCPQDLFEFDSAMVRHYLEDTLKTDFCRYAPCIGNEALLELSLKETDSIYLFQGHGGWGGGFDFVCALYPKNGAYWSKLMRLTTPPFHSRDIPPNAYEIIEQTITSEQWQKLGTMLRDSGFWCLPYRLEEGWGIDGPEYYLAAKEGVNFRLVRFQEFLWRPRLSPEADGEEISCTHKITPAATYMLELSGHPFEPYIGVFDQIDRDSFSLYFSTYSVSFARQCRLRLGQQILLDWTNPVDAARPLRLPRRLLDSIPYMIVEEKMVSGRVRKVALKKGKN